MGASQVEIVSQLVMLHEEVQALSPIFIAELPNPFGLLVLDDFFIEGFIGLIAFAKAKLSNPEYWVVGDVLELDRLQDLVQRYTMALTNK